MAKTFGYIVCAFICCLILANGQGKLPKAEGKLAKKSKTKAELHRVRLKQAGLLKNVSKVKKTRQDGGTAQQVLHDKTKNATNSMKRTLKVVSGSVFKNMINSVPLRRPLKLLPVKTVSPVGRSRLTSLRSSTFKPIHIYGSVPFKTFLSALSKSNGQDTGTSTPGYGSPVPQAPEGASNEPVESPQAELLRERALQARQFPGLGPVPIGPQGNVPMMMDGPRGPFNDVPLGGAVPLFPPGGMASYFGNPLGFHHAHHRLHRKGKAWLEQA